MLSSSSNSEKRVRTLPKSGNLHFAFEDEFEKVVAVLLDHFCFNSLYFRTLKNLQLLEYLDGKIAREQSIVPSSLMADPNQQIT